MAAKPTEWRLDDAATEYYEAQFVPPWPSRRPAC